MEENKNIEKIDLQILFKKLIARKKTFAIVLPTAFVLGAIFILGFPRTYSTDIKLAPELNSTSNSMGALGSLASSIGLNLNDLQTSDAISPLLYPNLMEDNNFICDLFNIKVESADGEIRTTYHDYLAKNQQPVIWNMPIDWIKNLFKKESAAKKSNFDPYKLNKNEEDIAKAIRGSINLKVDKKTAIITIEANAQDPLICKTVADSVKNKLQDFITDYRTNKARIDYEYYKKLTADAKRDYEKLRQQYASMSDANTKITLRSVELKLEDMENDLQLKFTTYTTLNTQLQAAKARVQERTPAFTVIKGAEVPVKPSGPKRMIFTIACVIAAFAVTSVYILAKDSSK